jgi:CheY-like chemotaxis protein/HPt (histidine-containing phosphotransfer) domain-containing protein
VVYRPTLSSNRIALIDGDAASIRLCMSELTASGYNAEIVASDNAGEMAQLTREITSQEVESSPPYGLVIVTSEALKRSRVFDLVVELRSNSAIPVVAILSPFEISVRERLLALNVPFVVTRPISLLDILGVLSGQISLNQEGWEDCEEQSLNTSRALEILVADDAQTNRIILTELLRDAGHNVVCVENGVEMVSQIKDSLEGAKGVQSFDIILTDVQMPLLDGLNATAQIRSLERKHGVIKHLPIIAVTAHAMTDETSRMRNFGIDDVVTKPLDPLRLGEVLQKLTGQRISNEKTGPIVSDGIKNSSASGRRGALSEREFCELALRLWTQMAKRDSDLRETFSLEDDPLDPKVFKSVLDINDVYERSGDSVRRTLLIFRGFGDCFREQLQRLSDGKQSRNLNDIRFGAHALKGLLLDVGAKASAELACKIEQLALKGESDQALSLISQLTKQVLLISRLVAQITNAAGDGDNGANATKLSAFDSTHSPN